MKKAGAEGTVFWDRIWWDRKWLFLWAGLILWYGYLLMKEVSFLSPALFVLLLALPALEDWRTGCISDGWSVLLAVTGLMTAFRRQGAVESFLSAALVLAIYMALYLISRKSMGTGDLVLSTGAAFWLSPFAALLFVWLSALSALLLLAIPLLAGRRSIHEEVRFGPFIAMGGVMAYGWQEIWGMFPPPWFPFS